MQEIALIERKELREQAIERIEVLDKVKQLFLIPAMDVMTIKQIADYFEIPEETVKTCYNRNKYEIDQDGVMTKIIKDFLKVQLEPLRKAQGKTIFKIAEGLTLVVPNRGIRVFPKRAVLRIAMLLRDSPVAKEIRTQLLNTFDASTPEQQTAAIDEETKLMIEIGRASMTGDVQQISIAYANAFAFKNRHIAALTESNQELAENNKALAGDILTWADRACINRAIRLIATKRGVPFGYVWRDLYNELRYKHNIGLTQRGNAPYIQHIKENEWEKVQQSLSAICENNGISVSKILKQARIKQ